MSLRKETTAAIGVAIFLLSACGGRSGATTTAPSATTSTAATAATAATTATTATTVSLLTSALGSRGDAAQATRTIVVHAGDDFRFNPASIQVKVGETVTFQVVNDGKAEHEFLLGNSQAQASEERLMSAMQSAGPMVMQDDTNVVYVPGGQSKSITWTFVAAGTTLYGSHESRDFAAGMVGTITVAP